METFIKSALTGLVISIAGTAYLSINNPIIGAIIFSFALITIVKLDLSLFTGKVGYIGRNNYKDILITLLGNFIGIFIYTRIFIVTRNYKTLVNRANEIVSTKLNDSNISILILSVFCGIVMYIAVESYRRKKNDLLLIMCVVVFIFSAYEHCIANFFYLSLTNSYDLLKLSLMIFGNAIGSIGFHKAMNFTDTRG